MRKRLLFSILLLPIATFFLQLKAIASRLVSNSSSSELLGMIAQTPHPPDGKRIAQAEDDLEDLYQSLLNDDGADLEQSNCPPSPPPEEPPPPPPPPTPCSPTSSGCEPLSSRGSSLLAKQVVLLGEITPHHAETGKLLTSQQKEVLTPQIVASSVGEWQGRSWQK